MAPPSWVGLVAGIALLAGAAVLGFEAVAGRPRRPRAATPRMELGDDPEPPALVGFLLDGCRVPTEVAAATLLDLAARGHVELEQLGERVRCRVPSADSPAPEQLEEYERLVLDHVRARAIDGVLPAEALATGPTAAAGRWWRRLRGAVVAHARRDGLSRRRWRRPVVLLAALPVVVAVVVLWVADQPDDVSVVAAPLSAVATLGVAALGWALVAAFESDRETHTGAGLAVAARWRAVHDFLAEHTDLTEMPAGGVVVWGRHLAYAAVGGLAPTAVRDLPLGDVDLRHTWSPVGGRWRPVTVSYPWWRPGWGQRPVLSVGAGLVGTAVAVVVARVALPGALDPVLLSSGDGSTAPPPWIAPVAWAVGVIAVAVGALFAVRAAWGVADLVGPRTVEGVVLRRVRGRVPDAGELLRRLVGLDRTPRPPFGDHRWVAVDTGDADRIRAWSVSAETYAAVRPGERVRVAVRPRLGHVAEVTSLGPPPASPQDGAGHRGDVAALFERAAAQLAALGERSQQLQRDGDDAG